MHNSRLFTVKKIGVIELLQSELLTKLLLTKLAQACMMISFGGSRLSRYQTETLKGGQNEKNPKGPHLGNLRNHSGDYFDYLA